MNALVNVTFPQPVTSSHFRHLMVCKFNLIFLCYMSLTSALVAQTQQPSTFGFRHLKMLYQGDTVDILIKSKKNDELKKKPLFLFIQGSLPVPLLITYQDGAKGGLYNVFVFEPDSLLQDYHLAIIGKPHVPLIAQRKDLQNDFTWSNTDGRFNADYVKRNYLDYYVSRNLQAIKFLQQQLWVSRERLVVAGHSEGSTIAAKLALQMPAVTHLIYSGGNPLGRILTRVQRERVLESASNPSAEAELEKWQQIVNDPLNSDGSNGDSFKTTFSFSVPPITYLEKLTIPVFICYGTKDTGAPFNDYLRVEMIRAKRKNFYFKSYIGVEHNYFPVGTDGSIDYEIFNWNKVVGDWSRWLINTTYRTVN